MKRLSDHSQHFLRSPVLVKELIGHSTIRPDETVIDIGAGSGVISSVLARTVAQVIAVEVEPRTASLLARNLERYTNVTLYRGDFLKMPLPKNDYSIFANIPFHLSSPILQRLIETPHPPRAAYLIVQKQFGNKLVATEAARFTGQLGMLVGIRYDVRIRRTLRKTDFWPHPAVDTVFIELLRRDAPRIPKERFAAYARFTKECFASPAAYTPMPLETAGIPPGTPPSRTTIDQWVALFKAQTRY